MLYNRKLKAKRGRPTQPKQGMGAGKGLTRRDDPMYRKAGRGACQYRKGRIDKRELDDQIIGRTMKARSVILFCSRVEPQMHIVVMRHQRMKHYLRRHRQRKEPKQAGGQKRSYGSMKVQAVFETRLHTQLCCKIELISETEKRITNRLLQEGSAWRPRRLCLHRGCLCRPSP